MIRAPDLTEIDAAERRVVQSKQDTLDSLCRARVAFGMVLAQPSTVGMMAAGGGLFGFWLGRRSQARPSPDGVRVAAGASAAVLLRGIVVRYGMQHLPDLVRQVWAAPRH